MRAARDWSVRHAGAFERLYDVTSALLEHGRTCRVDRTPRGWEKPSDHAPVVASFDLAD